MEDNYCKFSGITFINCMKLVLWVRLRIVDDKILGHISMKISRTSFRYNVSVRCDLNFYIGEIILIQHLLSSSYCFIIVLIARLLKASTKNFLSSTVSNSSNAKLQATSLLHAKIFLVMKTQGGVLLDLTQNILETSKIAYLTSFSLRKIETETINSP